MNSATFEKVRGIAADVLQVKSTSLDADSSPKTVAAWDSVQHLNLILALEESFDLQFYPEEMDAMQNIGRIAAIVDSKTGA